MLPLPPPFCGGPKILTSSAPLRTPSTLAFLPGGLCAISAAQSSLLHICIFPGTVQSLRPIQTSFLKLILAPRASTCFLCTGFTAWGSSDLAEKLTWHLSFSLTHCGVWVPTASGCHIATTAVSYRRGYLRLSGWSQGDRGSCGAQVSEDTCG